MIDITDKPIVRRQATSRGYIRLRKETLSLIKEGKIQKGDPLYVARISGVQNAKKTSSLIPFCHPISLTKVEVNTRIVDDFRIEVESTVKTIGQTGVEMESLVATATALLTIWDMTKQYEKDNKGQYPVTAINDIRIISKIKEKER